MRLRPRPAPIVAVAAVVYLPVFHDADGSLPYPPKRGVLQLRAVISHYCYNAKYAYTRVVRTVPHGWRVQGRSRVCGGRVLHRRWGQPRLRAQTDTGKAWRPKKNQVRYKRRSNSRMQRGFAVGDWRSVMRSIFVICLIPRVCPRIAYYGTANNPEARAGRFASANPARLNPALQDTRQSAGYAAYEAAWRTLGSGGWRGAGMRG